jgi:hypothetical protein
MGALGSNFLETTRYNYCRLASVLPKNLLIFPTIFLSFSTPLPILLIPSGRPFRFDGQALSLGELVGGGVNE